MTQLFRSKWLNFLGQNDSTFCLSEEAKPYEEHSGSEWEAAHLPPAFACTPHGNTPPCASERAPGIRVREKPHTKRVFFENRPALYFCNSKFITDHKMYNFGFRIKDTVHFFLLPIIIIMILILKIYCSIMVIKSSICGIQHTCINL